MAGWYWLIFPSDKNSKPSQQGREHVKWEATHKAKVAIMRYPHVNEVRIEDDWGNLVETVKRA